jgi:hypothetical protein
VSFLRALEPARNAVSTKDPLFAPCDIRPGSKSLVTDVHAQSETQRLFLRGAQMHDESKRRSWPPPHVSDAMPKRALAGGGKQPRPAQPSLASPSAFPRRYAFRAQGYGTLATSADLQLVLNDDKPTRNKLSTPVNPDRRRIRGNAKDRSGSQPASSSAICHNRLG